MEKSWNSHGNSISNLSGHPGKILMLITSFRVKIQLNLRTFIGQFFKGNSMGPIKINGDGNYAHAQYCDAYDFSSLRVKIQLTLK